MKMKFKDYPLDNQIKRALSELAFQSPLEVQEEAIPKILEGKDLTVKSRTGSGKTGAFAIPICEMIDSSLEAVQAVIMAPTRELAQQVREDINDIGKYKGIKSIALYGNQLMEIQRKALKDIPHIIVSTPGRLMDHIMNKNVKLSNVKFLVLDEADEMLLMGFKDQLEYVIAKIPEERTTLLFSATINEEVKEIAEKYLNNPENIEIEFEENPLEKIEQLYYAVEGLKKVDFMKKVIKYEKPQKGIIFCNTKEQVDNLYTILKKWDNAVCAFHGGVDQTERQEILKDFKKGQYRILIATDLAARGIHVVGITHVINYSVPFEPEQYVHRIGRTGRVDEKGVAITFVMPSEMDRFRELEDFLGYKIPCKGGYVNTAPKVPQKNRRDAGRFKDTGNRKKAGIIRIEGGKLNSSLQTRDILYTIRNINGVNNEDIGKVDIKDKITEVVVYGGKEDIILKELKKT
ncbi:MAG: DEAD/DEAH box helicase, partial [Clostridia bacterium]|nr:DEAD/DEAH box helicase [Clostridia bacterium]